MAYDPSATTARFDVLRKRLKEESAKTGQEQEEAIKRRFASQGMLRSGAYLKSQEEGASKLQETTQKGLEDIGFAEAGEQQRQKEVEEARQYQTSERESAQKFASGEREAGQKFQSGEAQTQRLFSKQLFDEDMDFKKLVNEQNYGLAKAEFEESKKSNLANLAVALKTSGMSDFDMDTLFQRAGEILGGGPGSNPQREERKNTVSRMIDNTYRSGNESATRLMQDILRTYGFDKAHDQFSKISAAGYNFNQPNPKLDRVLQSVQQGRFV